MLSQPSGHEAVDRLTQRAVRRLVAGAGIQQQRTIIAEEQIEEGGLTADGLVLPQHVGVRIIGVDLENQVGAALPASPAS